MRRPGRILLVVAVLALLSAGSPCPAHAVVLVAPNTESAGKMTVEIRGEVEHPGSYELREGERISSLILRAGETTDKAWLPGAVLIRVSERKRQAVELVGIAVRLEAAVREAPSTESEFGHLARMLHAIPPAGRVPVRLSHPRLMINGPEDLPLEEGDDLYIPPLPRTVRVAGAVRNPGEYPLSPGGRLPGLAAVAGGFLPEADRNGTILLKADGTARMLSEGWIVWNAAAGRWEFSPFRKNRPRIEAGDTIFVPRDPGRMPWPGGIDDFRRTMMRILEITGSGEPY